MNFLTEHNKNDFANWQKRLENQIKAKYANHDNQDEAAELIETEKQKEVAAYKAKMDSPCVVPFSEENLKISD